MNRYMTTIALYCFLTGTMPAAYAEAGVIRDLPASAVQPETADSMDAEYE